MSNNLSTAINMGAKAPVILIMKLNRSELAQYIAQVDPNQEHFLTGRSRLETFFTLSVPKLTVN